MQIINKKQVDQIYKDCEFEHRIIKTRSRPAGKRKPMGKNVSKVLDAIKCSYKINRKELIAITKLSPGCMTKCISVLKDEESIVVIEPETNAPYDVCHYEINGNK